MHFIRQFKENLESKGSFIVFDTETTGLSAESCDIIEFAAQKYAKDGTVIDSIDIFIDPGYPIPEEIVSLTGITDADVKGQYTTKTGYEAIKAFFGDKPIALGYNVSFDVKFVSALYSKCGDEFAPLLTLDVLKMVRENLPKPHKLINACENLGFANDFKFHRAIEDVQATGKVFYSLLPKYDGCEDGDALSVIGLARWQKHGFNRIYITNSQNASAFYDVVNDKWTIPSEYDEEETIKAVYAFAGVSDTKELDSFVA